MFWNSRNQKVALKEQLTAAYSSNSTNPFSYIINKVQKKKASAICLKSLNLQIQTMIWRWTSYSLQSQSWLTLIAGKLGPLLSSSRSQLKVQLLAKCWSLHQLLQCFLQSKQLKMVVLWTCGFGIRNEEHINVVGWKFNFAFVRCKFYFLILILFFNFKHIFTHLPINTDSIHIFILSEGRYS